MLGIAGWGDRSTNEGGIGLMGKLSKIVNMGNTGKEYLLL